MTDLTTIPALRQAIKKAPDDMTPEKFEMFGGTTFGKIEEDGTVSLG
ncbi:hypothetical protein LAV_00157 [Sphingobium phage Lacusarx]|uniref:Uncharacterized protein n=1 Tax=Sphingobium phage Lacusarx TaxID=1980139 RepID=A0A1W6DXN6_9CAUD|nr:hypothetical protein FDH44_gp146 [Sphingobium phage Lacusarx]ARK07532.1 hypothetical protein LAV_00157 [Sphingobium phage Lacusarx]